jgi:hypothetical protein
LRFSDRPVAASAIPRNEAGGGQRFFSRMPAAAAGAQRTPFTQQQASVRSAFGGAGGNVVGRENVQTGGVQSQAGGGSSSWRRFGEPSQSGGASAAPARSSQPGGNPGGNSPGAGWDRFGSPQRSSPPAAAPQQGQARLPSVIYGSGASNYQGNYQGGGGQSRALQVAPPIVQQRSAPGGGGGGGYRSAPAPSYRSAPQSSGGGGHSSGGHSGGHR